MRILLASDFYAPSIGGLERHVARLAKALMARGHEVVVVTSATPHAPSHSVEDGVTVRRLTGWTHRVPFMLADSDRPFPLPFPDWSLVRALRAEFDRFDPDVVHAHGWMAIPSAAASNHRSHALIATLHDSGLTCAKRVLFQDERTPCTGPGLAKCARCVPSQYGIVKGTAIATMLRSSRSTLSRIDRFLPVAGFLGDLLVPDIATADQVEVVPNFFDADDVPGSAVSRPDFLPADRPFVLFVGTLGRFKGVDFLVDIWRSSPPPAELVMIGASTPETPRVLPRGVRMITDVPHAHVMAALRHAAVAVLPSQFPEPSPTVVLEAMSCGVPVVASRIGGIPDLVDHGRTGILVDSTDHATFARALVRLLADASLRNEFGERAVKRAALFAVGPIVDRIESNYHKAILAHFDHEEIHA